SQPAFQRLQRRARKHTHPVAARLRRRVQHAPRAVTFLQHDPAMLEGRRDSFMTVRYALYYAPEEGSALGRFGSEWFAREDLRAFTVAPRRYGFHATLKAPFRLARGERVEDLVRALKRFCAGQPAFRLPPLKVALLEDFLALVPVAAEPRLDA